jgi:hypothetical protein
MTGEIRELHALCWNNTMTCDIRYCFKQGHGVPISHVMAFFQTRAWSSLISHVMILFQTRAGSSLISHVMVLFQQRASSSLISHVMILFQTRHGVL